MRCTSSSSSSLTACNSQFGTFCPSYINQVDGLRYKVLWKVLSGIYDSHNTFILLLWSWCYIVHKWSVWLNTNPLLQARDIQFRYFKWNVIVHIYVAQWDNSNCINKLQLLKQILSILLPYNFFNMHLIWISCHFLLRLRWICFECRWK